MGISYSPCTCHRATSSFARSSNVTCTDTDPEKRVEGRRAAAGRWRREDRCSSREGATLTRRPPGLVRPPPSAQPMVSFTGIGPLLAPRYRSSSDRHWRGELTVEFPPACGIGAHCPAKTLRCACRCRPELPPLSRLPYHFVSAVSPDATVLSMARNTRPAKACAVFHA